MNLFLKAHIITAWLTQGRKDIAVQELITASKMRVLIALPRASWAAE